MNAFILPYVNGIAGFTGQIYVYNFRNDVNCLFIKRTEYGFEGYGITLPLSGTGACSQGRKEVDDGNVSKRPMKLRICFLFFFVGFA